MIQKPVKNCDDKYIANDLFGRFDILNSGRIYRVDDYLGEMYKKLLVKKRIKKLNNFR
jgi:hypothetical protein